MRRWLILAFLSGFACAQSGVPILGSTQAPSGAMPTLLTHCVATNTGTCTINTTGASLIVVMDVAGSATVTAPTENKGNTFQVPGAAGFARASDSGQIYYICSPTTSSTHIFTGHAASNIYFVSAWSGTAASSCFDVGSGGQATGGATCTPGSISPGTTNELLVSAAINVDTGNAWTVPSTGGTWTSIDTSTSYGAEASAYLVDPSTSANNPNWTATGPPTCGSELAAFKHP